MISDTIYYFGQDEIRFNVSADELNQGLLNGENPLPSSLKDLFVKMDYTIKILLIYGKPIE